jgi:Zinc carboxypeptidase/Carboxypeptidase activation peptide
MKVLLSVLACLHLSVYAVLSGDHQFGNYEGSKVYRFFIGTEQEFHILEETTSTIPEGAVSFWTELNVGRRPVDILASATAVPLIDQLEGKLNYSVIIKNVKQVIEDQAKDKPDFVASGIPTEVELFKSYWDAEVYVNYLTSLCETERIVIGKTYLGVDIAGVKFGTGARQVVINGGIHAREWLSPSTTTYIANQLLKNTTDAIYLRSAFTFHFIPVLNVDGYAYSRASTENRLWRKNMQPSKISKCIGTDPNRNFPNHWSQPGASSVLNSDLESL